MKKYLLISLFACLLSACTAKSTTPAPTMPGSSLSLDQMNKALSLAPSPLAIETFKGGGLIDLDLRNISSNSIVFAQDFSVQLFIKKQGQWSQVDNAFLYGGGDLQLPPPPDPRSLTIMGVDPLIPVGELPATMRVIVTGKLKSTGQPVGAYIDLNLPQRDTRTP